MNQLQNLAVSARSAVAAGSSASWFSRAELLDAGDLRDVSSIAREAGFRVPVAVSCGVWSECVELGSTQRSAPEETERLWSVLWGARSQTGVAPGQPRSYFELEIASDGRHGTSCRSIQLELLVSRGDDGRQAVTIMKRGEH
jgi:hypothetical protein